MIVPWDNSLSTTGSCVGRYWGKAAWYADLYRFVRAQARLLDGFEHASSAGGVDGDMSGPTAAAVRANSSEVIVLVRTPSGTPIEGHPVGVVHLVRLAYGDDRPAARPGIYNNSDCAGNDLGRPLVVTSLDRCQKYCRSVTGCDGYVLGGVPNEIEKRCGAKVGATPRQYCCLPKADCTTIQHKDNDTAVVLSGAPTKSGPSGSLQLRFQVRHQLKVTH